VPSALLKIGDGYYSLKRYAQAANSYSNMVRAYPKSKEAPEADFGILLCLLQEKKYDSFISRVETFLKRYPQHALASQALMQLGDYYQQERMKEKAVKTYRELITLSLTASGQRTPSSASPFYLCRTEDGLKPLRKWTKWSAIFPKVIFLSRPMLNWEVSIFSFKITQKLSNDTNG